MKKKIVEADENIFVTEDGEVFHNNKKLKYRFTKSRIIYSKPKQLSLC